jgi:Dolichyl-phosphate-mannose-protein mannosyltransferase
VTAIARSLGASRRGQVLAAVIGATIPEGILTASGAKNDHVLSFWMVALAYYVLSFRDRASWLNAAGMGAALGLACLTKGTAYVFAAPMLLTLSILWSWPVNPAAGVSASICRRRLGTSRNTSGCPAAGRRSQAGQGDRYHQRLWAVPARRGDAFLPVRRVCALCEDVARLEGLCRAQRSHGRIRRRHGIHHAPANAATGGRPVGPPPLTAAGVQELRELFPRLPKLDTEDRPGAIP